MSVSLHGDVPDMILYTCMDCRLNCCGLGRRNINLVYPFHLGIYSLELNYMNIRKHTVFRWGGPTILCIWEPETNVNISWTDMFIPKTDKMYSKDKVVLFENYTLRNV